MKTAQKNDTPNVRRHWQSTVRVFINPVRRFHLFKYVVPTCPSFNFCIYRYGNYFVLHVKCIILEANKAGGFMYYCAEFWASIEIGLELAEAMGYVTPCLDDT